MEENKNFQKAQRIEDYLLINSKNTQDFSILSSYSTLHLHFTSDVIELFYIRNCTSEIFFDTQKLTVNEILYNCDDFLCSISDTLYSFIVCNTFITKNSLCFNSIVSLEGLKEFIKSEELIIQSDTSWVLPPTERIVNLITIGSLPFFITTTSLNAITLTKHTFKHLIRTGISIPELMTYKDLDANEVQLVSYKLIEDSSFEKRCKKYIEDQGILNNTMQIISSLCNINIKPNYTDKSALHLKYCGTHFSNIYIPYNEFRSIGDITKIEAYLLYLYNKKDIKDDIDDINIALNDTHVVISRLHTQQSSLQFSMTPIDNNCFFNETRRSISAQILDLVYKRDLNITISTRSFANFYELSKEPYYEKIILQNARDIVNCGVYIPLLPLYSEIYEAIQFLDQKRKGIVKKFKNECKADSLRTLETDKQTVTAYMDGSTKTQETDKQTVTEYMDDSTKPKVIGTKEDIVCSLDALGSTLFFSSLGSNQDQIETMNTLHNDNQLLNKYPDPLPFLDFTKHIWLLEAEAITLLQEYIKIITPDKLVNNFLILKHPPDDIKTFFIKNIELIKDKNKKALLCCSLDIPFELSSFNDLELRTIITEAENLFEIRAFLMTKKIAKKFIYKVFTKISDEKMQILMREIFTVKTTDDFLIIFVETLCKMYEFSHICNQLIQLIKLNRLEITKYIQTYFIRLLKGLFVVESYIPLFELLYSALLIYEDITVKTNNDLILGLIVKCAAAMEKETTLGNIKQSNQ